MDFDLYEDIIGEKADGGTIVSSEEVERWREEVKETKSKLKRIMAVNQSLHNKCSSLETNMSSLIKTCKNEINRKNETIAGLRRELDNVILRRTNSGRSADMRHLLQELKKILREDKPPKLLIPGISEKNKNAVTSSNGIINVTNIPLNEDVYVFKVGNTSFSFVRHGDIRHDEAKGSSQLLKIEQRTSPAEEVPVPRTGSKQEKKKVANDKSDSRSSKVSKECRLDDVRRSSDRHPSTRRESSNSSSSRFSSKRNDTSNRSSRCSKVKSPRKRTSPTAKSERSRKTPSKKTPQNESPKSTKKSARTSNKSDSTAEDDKRTPPGNLPDDLFDVETTELDHIVAEKKRQLEQLAVEAKAIIQTKKPKTVKDKENTAIDSADQVKDDLGCGALDNGLQNSSGFLDSWTEASFTSYKTPPSKSRQRQRTESEHSSGDFSSVAGIAQILKGKLVPSNSTQVSPRTGMIVTPPVRKSVGIKEMPSPSKMYRTRHRSKEIANEINQDSIIVSSSKKNAQDNLLETLGLSISESESEASPIKVTRKRKKSSLGFSDPPPLAKRSMQL